MKPRHFLIKLLALFFLIAGHAEAAEKPLNHAATTARYYQKLISGTHPELAELSLFTRLMPKGGDIHHHYDGSLYAENYLDWVAQGNFCIYREDIPALNARQFHVELDPSRLPEAARSQCLSADAVRQDSRFQQDLLKRWSVKDYGNHAHAQIPPDQHFFSTFPYFIPLANYSYRAGLEILKKRALAENVQYLESVFVMAPVIENEPLAARLNALRANTPDADLEAALSAYASFIANDDASQQTIMQYRQTVEQAATGLDGGRFRMRFHAFVFRNQPPAQVFSSMVSAFTAAKASKLIVGVNIVGAENAHVAMRDYTLHMKMFRFLKQRFPGVKLSLHAGELVPGMVPPEGLTHHVRDALLMAGADRIGHGVDIAHEQDADALLRMMRQRQVPVEINLTSNAFILGVKDQAHPIRLYRKQRVPYVIASDDTGVSRHSLSEEYLLYASRYRPTYAELKDTVYNSIRYSFLNNEEKCRELAELDRRFADFERKMVRLAKSRRD